MHSASGGLLPVMGEMVMHKINKYNPWQATTPKIQSALRSELSSINPFMLNARMQ